MRSPRRTVSHSLAGILVLAVLGSTACGVTGGTLGGREKCWPEEPARAASVWRGIFRVDASGGRLDTPEGDVIRLVPGALQTRIGEGGIGELLHGSDVVASAGDDVTLFGGMSSDGALVVCAVEEKHAEP